MATLSIGEAWNETASFARREAHLLFPVAFLLMALPGAILQAFIPPAVPGRPPELGLWMAFLPAVLILSLVGTLAVTHLALKPGSSVGEAIQRGGSRFIFLLGSALLVGLGAAAVMIALAMVVVLVAGTTGDAPSPVAVALVILLCLPVFVFFWVRLVLMTPVAAAESGGSIAIIQRSWTLTRGHFWPLLGFLVLFVIVLLVLSVAVGAIGALLVYLAFGVPEPGSIAMFVMLLISALLNAVLSALFTVLLARVYVRLAGPDHSGVFA